MQIISQTLHILNTLSTNIFHKLFNTTYICKGALIPIKVKAFLNTI